MTERWEFKVEGLDCAEEVTILKRSVGPIVGGEDQLAFDVLSGKMVVLAPKEPLTQDQIVTKVASTGMKAEAWTKDGASAKGRNQARFWTMILSGVFVLLGFLTHLSLGGGLEGALGVGENPPPVPPFAIALYALAIAFGAWFILPKAWFALKSLRADMNLLMVIAVIGAVLIGEWFEGAVVSFLFAVSLWLEAWSIGRARRAVDALLDLGSPTARIRNEAGQEIEAEPETVEVGTNFLVFPGERLPLDGRIAMGTSHIDQAPITGESIPVLKEPGDEVFAGTVNGEGALEIESTKPAQGTVLAHIIREVREAESNRAPSEQWVERFARVYTPAIFVMALLVFLLPPLLFGGAWDDWAYNALVLLVIGCPCALVISTPVSIVAALARAAQMGVLVKGGLYMEEPSKVKAIAFDKTGTITEGKPAVVDVIPFDEHDEAWVLASAAALESRSEHPLAKAILDEANERGIGFEPATEGQALGGKGVHGRIDDREFWLGSHRYLEERDQETAEVHQLLEDISSDGKTSVVLGNESHVCGIITIADRVRPEAKATFDRLRASGIQEIVILSGDNQGTVEAVGKVVGADEVRGELLPSDKVDAIEQLVTKHGHAAMVGDGVNDAPALARASLGIAIGAAGSDAAIETADIALMADEIERIPWLIEHSKRTTGTIRANIIFALSIKAIFVVLALFGEASLWSAIAADMGASLLVVLNGIRLLRS